MLSVDRTLDREKLLDFVGFGAQTVMLQDPKNSDGDRDVLISPWDPDDSSPGRTGRNIVYIVQWSAVLVTLGAWGHLGREEVLRGQWQQGLSYG